MTYQDLLERPGGVKIRRITLDILRDLYFDTSTKGSQRLLMSIHYILEGRCNRVNITRELYPTVEDWEQTTGDGKKIERTIRSVIQTSYDSMLKKAAKGSPSHLWTELFGEKVYDKCPSNSMFIYRIADWIYMEREDIRIYVNQRADENS